MKSLWAVLVLLSTAVRPEAPERQWILVSISGDTTTYLDSLSVKPVTSHWIEAWSRVTYATPHQGRDGAFDNLLERRWLDCAGARIRTVQSASYLGATLVRGSTGSAARRTWYHVRSGTTGHVLTTMACRIAGKEPPG